MNSWTGSRCPQHGRPIHRASCNYRNAAYMNEYTRRRRVDMPSHPYMRGRESGLVSGVWSSRLLVKT